MALYKTITVNPNTKVLIWKIEESYEELEKGLTLTPKCLKRLESMKSDIHQKGFLSIRQLLKLAGILHMIYIMMRMENLTLLMVKKFLLPILFSFLLLLLGKKMLELI